MKKSLLFLSLVFTLGLSVNATDYYIASNGNDNNNGTSQSSPWRSLEKLNAYSSNLKAGDKVLLRRGDTFYGKIEASNAGRSGNPIIYGAYGSGDKPIITGFTEVNSWNNLGGNIWESSTAVSSLSTLNMVVINGVNTPMGRYPNADITYPFMPNFYKFQSHTGNGPGSSSITSNNLNGGINWTGAEVVVRVTQWLLDRAKITRQSGSQIFFENETAGDPIEDNWGFFIQNDIKTLDNQNEWYYNPVTKRISLYSLGAPSNVKICSIDTLFNSHNFTNSINHISVENINFIGANTTSISFNGNGNKVVPTVTNCNILNAGIYGISTSGLSSAVIENNTISHTGQSAIWCSNGNNILIKNNTVRMTGVISTFNRTGFGGSAIFLNTKMDNSVIQYNNIDSTQNNGIHFAGNNVLVKNNFINNSAMHKGDAGGIYTFDTDQTGRIIEGNIVMNSKGNPRGTPDNSYYAFGIYIDELGSDIKVDNNTVIGSSASGLILRNVKNVSVKNNTLYENGSIALWGNANLFIQGDGGKFSNYVRGNTVTDNILFAKGVKDYPILYYSTDNTNGVGDFGVIDNNYFAKPIDPSTSIRSWQNGDKRIMNLAQWKIFSGKDANSKDAPKIISNENELRFEYNANISSKTIALDANYIDVKGNTYNGTITLSPYTSAVLIRDGNILDQQTPVANAGSEQTITLPTNNTILNGSGSVEGGFIASYNWTKLSGPTSGNIVNPAEATTSLSNLDEGVYVFQFKVTDNKGVTSTAEVKVIVLPYANLLPAVTISNLVNGIDYKYYEGSYNVVPDFSSITPVKKGIINSFDLSQANRLDNFAFEFTGYIDIPADGQYTFYSTSDDGSLLYIDGNLIVNNDGLHSAIEKSGTIGLKAGKHGIIVKFFEQKGDQILNISYSGEGLSKRQIPASAVYRISQEELLPAVNPSGIESGINYKYYEGIYSVVPDFTSLTPVKSGIVSNFNLSVANRPDNFAFEFTGYIDVPADGQYTFYTTSDDGSLLYIDGKLIVNNDGLHSALEKSGTIGLMAGKHAIIVKFFEQTGDQILNISYSGGGLSKRLIPASVVYRMSQQVELLPAVNPTNIINGIVFKYFEGSYARMPLFSSLNSVKTGSIANFDLSVANRSEAFAINYTGFIEVPADGVYTFYTGSDDGSRLFIDHELVVNNDGLHGWIEQSGTIGLKAGKHYLSLEFFQATGGKSLDVYYSGPGITQRKIPSSALYMSKSEVNGIINFGGQALASSKPMKDQSGSDLNEIGIKAYPNPFLNSFVVSINGEAGEYTLQMLDALGRTLWIRSGSKNEGFYQQTINTTQLDKGVYFLKIIQNNNNRVIKLLK